MKNLLNIAAIEVIFVFLAIAACSKNTYAQDYPQQFTVTLENGLSSSRNDEVINIGLSDIKEKYPDFNPQAFVVFDGPKELSSQANDLDGDKVADEIAFLTDLNGGQSKTVYVRYAPNGEKKHTYPKRTQAELSHKFGGKFVNGKYQGGQFRNVDYLRVPDNFIDHSWYIRYEGPGWESDKVGYRFYLDWRNATDIFGKKVSDMVLQNVGLDGFDSYHKMQPWGQDILKVGKSLGIGSIARWHDNKAERVAVTDSVTCAIVVNGPIQSRILTRYWGWKVGDNSCDLISTLTIDAGSRMTLCDLKITGNPENICTGIVKEDSVVVLKSSSGGGWQYFATYGKQSLANDSLGMAVLYPKNDLVQLTEDKLSHVVVLNPKDGHISYYFLAAWDKEPGGIINRHEFSDYLNKTILKLNNPVKVIL